MMERHIIAWSRNGDEAPVMSQEFRDMHWAAQTFDALVDDPQTNWVKSFTIRANGQYLFNEEYQRRTIQAHLKLV